MSILAVLIDFCFFMFDLISIFCLWFLYSLPLKKDCNTSRAYTEYMYVLDLYFALWLFEARICLFTMHAAIAYIVRILYNAQSELIKLAIIISSPVCIYTKTQFVCASGKEWCMQMCMSVIISRVFRICCVFRCICRHTRYTAFNQWTLCCYVIGVHININCAVIQTAWSPVYMQCAEEKEKRKNKEWRGKAWNRRQNCYLPSCLRQLE